MATSTRSTRMESQHQNKRSKKSKKGYQERGLLKKQRWKPFEVDMVSFADEEMSGFMGMEVLTEYDPKLLKTFKSTSGTKAKAKAKQVLEESPSARQKVKGESKILQSRGKVLVKQNRDDAKSNIITKKSKEKTKLSNKKKKVKPRENDGNIDPLQDKGSVPTGKVTEKNRKRKSGRDQLQELRMDRKRRKSEHVEEQNKDTSDEAITPDIHDEIVTGTIEVAMTAWDTLTIPSVVHQSLLSMGFIHPTPIQTACIPAAISGKKDIVGAAETGSGKTLAFGIPLIYRILQQRAAIFSGTLCKGSPDTEEKRDEDTMAIGGGGTEALDRQSDGSTDTGRHSKIKEEGGGQEEEEEEKEEDLGNLKVDFGCVNVIDNIDDNKWLEAGLPLVSFPLKGSGQRKKLFGLVLTPTRELAVQVKNHLVAAAKMTDIKVAVVVGGMSAEKQKRMLKKEPDIIVGTPGRLWELFKLGEPFLSSLPDVQCLVIDEADRMVEKGHYAELSEILDLLNSSESQPLRQIFVFSATLSLIHLGPLRKSIKAPYKKDKKDKLESVMSKVGIKENAEVVDLTNKEGTASSLLESKIACEVDQKDVYLFYFLHKYPGRTLVFTNSIDCIRRLVSIFTLLQCNPLPLHSSMHQKQRLKNLERFTNNPLGLLLATDVAARGLDIPDIEHVIHYQVARTSESYVHRSGRTARQAKVGLSISLVSPNELNFYRRLCKTLNREDLPTFPVDLRYYQEVSQRVDVATDIDKLEHVYSKKKHQNDWFVRAAKELDVDVDEDMNLHDLGDPFEQKQFNKKLTAMRGHLKSMLKKKIFAPGSSQLYPTSNGKLLSPFSQARAGTHEAASKLKARIRTDKVDNSKEKDKKQKKFKRMGRYQEKT